MDEQHTAVAVDGQSAEFLRDIGFQVFDPGRRWYRWHETDLEVVDAVREGGRPLSWSVLVYTPGSSDPAYHHFGFGEVQHAVVYASLDDWGRTSRRRLTAEARRNREDFLDRGLLREGCTCVRSPPDDAYGLADNDCPWCTHPGNPESQMADPDCWEGQ